MFLTQQLLIDFTNTGLVDRIDHLDLEHQGVAGQTSRIDKTFNNAKVRLHSLNN